MPVKPAARRHTVTVWGALLGLTGLAACQSTVAPPPARESGFNPAEFSAEVRPQDDFFDYINANWVAANEIPPDRSRFGVFNIVFDRTEGQVRELIEGAAEAGANAGPGAARIGALYRSYMNETAVNAAGLEPLADLFASVDAIASYDDLVTLFGQWQHLDVNLPVVFYVDGDASDPSRSLAYLWQAGLGLPDRDYYLNDGDKYANFRSQYLAHLTRMFELGGWGGGAQAASRVLDLEQRLAQRQWSRVQNRDRQRIYTNKVTLTDHPDEALWRRFLSAGEFGALDVVILAQDDYFAGLPGFLGETPLDTWRAYLRARLLQAFAGYLAEPFAEEAFAFYGKVLRGQETQRPRWKRAVSTVNGLLGEQVGQLYVEAQFPPGAKAQIGDMVEGLRTAFAESIDQLDWMQPATKAEARRKLAAFNKKIGYPDDWRDYSALVMKDDDLVGNVRRGRRFENARQIAKLWKPVDRSEWGMTPQTINAYYRPTFNEIVFPAAILQPPFFDPSVDAAFNYGAIGAVIGHEFSHGFDDQGRKFDGSGALRDWWTAADAEAYRARADVLVAQYDAYRPLPDVPINGRLTLGENIGDLAGLTMAYRAYRNHVADTWPNGEAPVIDGFTGDQRFFIGYAHAWRGKYRDEALRERLLSDPHSPGKYRVIGVLRNLDAFYSAFDVQPGDAMYLPPDERVRIW